MSSLAEWVISIFLSLLPERMCAGQSGDAGAEPMATPEHSVAAVQWAQTALAGAERGVNAGSGTILARERNFSGCVREKWQALGLAIGNMTSCRHHSGYLADDEAGHTTYVARVSVPSRVLTLRSPNMCPTNSGALAHTAPSLLFPLISSLDLLVQPPKKPLFPEMGRTSKLGHMPHPPSTYGPTSGSGFHMHCRKPKGPQPFGSFLDFLVKGQVLDSLQTVVEEATERVATMKTEAGVPLVEVQDPMEVPRGRQHRRARPNLSTVLRHRAQPRLCTGHLNNYPSCSSSMSDSPSSFMTQDSYLGAHGLGPLPPIRNRLLMEKNLERLLRLENKGKGLGLSSNQRDPLFWESLGSQASSQWTSEQPLSWFSGLMGSSMSTPETSETGIGEQDLIFLQQKFNKEIQSLLSQPLSFNLPGYCSLREPHRTLDFLAEHHLFPALQHVISQAVDKLSGARRHDGCPLFPSAEWEATSGPNSDPMPGSKPITLTDEEEPNEFNESIPTTASNSKMVWRKSNKGKGRGKPKEGGSPVPSAQMSTRFTFKVTPKEESKVPSPSRSPRQEVPDPDGEVQRSPVSTSRPSLTFPHRPQPWRSLHLTLPSPKVVVELPSDQAHPTIPVIAPPPAPCILPCRHHHHHHHPHPHPMCTTATPLTLVNNYPPASTSLCVEMASSRSPSYKSVKKKPLPSISSKSTVSCVSNPWLVNYLTEQALSLLIYKYKYEKNLTKQLGFISFPVTEVLMDLFLGFKKVKGSCIHLSSRIDWNCLLQKLEEAEWAQQAPQGSQQAPQEASRQVSLQASPKASQQASHQGFQQASWPVSQHSKEFPSTVPQLATDRKQDSTAQLSLHTDLLHSPSLTPQETTTMEKQELTSLSELKVSVSSSASMGSTRFMQVVTMEDTHGSEMDDSFSGEKGEPHSLPEPHGETPVSLSSDMSHGDPP
ncbi:Coiled-coil domain-containing protein 116 [Galemys pyrenaicus]|uniref:Coiled-coil domain-containing protein 116 n=1 Tax=Galemys pyrenaicus TaxID=202257 RepID=A0A8J6DW91_GALPY|nr:Coiled-coil domain-containing protein 116 [Galemys pyrenaicus]